MPTTPNPDATTLDVDQTIATAAPDDLATPDDLTPDKAKERDYETTAYGVPVVRVLDNDTRHIITMAGSAYDAAVTADPKRYTRLSSPAVDDNGAPLGPKFQTPKGE